MIRAAIISLVTLGACTPLTGGQIKDAQGQPVEFAYVFMQPLCLVFCSTQLSTTGSDVDSVGSQGAVSNTQTSTLTQSPTQTGTIQGNN